MRHRTNVLERPLEKPAPLKLTSKNYDHLIGMEGFSDKLLNSHFKLYQAYVSNTNTLLQELDFLSEQGKDHSPQFSEMKRRLGWEFNGVRLHEYYFDNLVGTEKLGDHPTVVNLLTRSFGTIDRWKKDFVAAGAMRGIGWVILYHDPPSNRLFNFWIEEHNANHIAGGHPLLVMDVFEHAFMIDYGTDKAKYIEAFFRNINWKVVAERCKGLLSPAERTFSPG